MRRWSRMFLLAVFLGGCATGFRPFPPRNQDARVGIVRNWVKANANLWIKDEAGRVVEEWYIAPAEDPISSLDINRGRAPVTVEKSLPPGHYTVEVIPFHYVWSGVGGPRCQRQLIGWQCPVDLPRRSGSIFVGRDPLHVHDRYTGQHWGWRFEIN